MQNQNDAGPGSLRQAIADANPNDVVSVPPGTYGLAPAGALTIGKNLTVRGAGAGQTIIDAEQGGRVLAISDGTVALEDLTVTGGRTTNAAGIHTTTNLTLDGVVVRGNVAGGMNAGGNGGGIFIAGQAEANLSLVNSSVIENRAGGGGPAGDGTGGGIYSEAAGSGTTRNITLDHSSLSRNVAGGDNGAGYGAGINVDQGVASATWVISVVDSTIDGNRAGGGGEEGDAGGAGINAEVGGASNNMTIDVTRSTISRNQAGGGNGAGYGGGISFSVGGGNVNQELDVTDSTIAGNTAGGGGDEGDGGGGGIAYSVGGGGGSHTMTLRHATVVANRAGGGGGNGIGGGLSLGGEAYLRNTIVANNTGALDVENCDTAVTGSFASIEDADTCALTGLGDKPDTEPLLRPLGNYGGPTQTMPPLVGSPAINNAQPGFCTDTDQRGIPRPETACDIGAGELVFSDLAVTARASRAKPAVGQPVTYTYTVRNNGPSAASGVTLRDVLPAKLGAATAKSAQGGTCTGARTVSCSLGTLPVGASRTVTVTARPIHAGQIVNTATVSSFSGDTVPGNSAAGATVRAIPSVFNLTVKPNPWRLGKETTIGFRLSDPAKVTLSFSRRVRGSKVDGKCGKKQPDRPKCFRFVGVGSRTLQGKQGLNEITFKGKLGDKELKPGRYRIRARAKDALGNRSPAAQAKFRLQPR